MYVKLKTKTPNIEETIVEIARVSSTREDKKAESPKLINYLIKNKHWSPFEHGFLTFEIETSRGIAAQLLRHRSNFFQEFSQRYQNVNALDNGEGIFEEIELRKSGSTNRQSSLEEINPLINISKEDVKKIDSLLIGEEKLSDSLIGNWDAKDLSNILLAFSELVYNKMIEKKIAKECARFHLPLATKTKLYITMNVRSIVHWMDLRDDGHAQKEVVAIAQKIKELIIEHLPIISEARGYIK